jgi:hypothetical protein
MRPDHALQDETRLRFVAPRSAPPEGLATVSVDLSDFFAVVQAIGRDEALLLLVVRALRQRTGLLTMKVHDLAWMLRVPNRRVLRWLDRLTREHRVVYHVEDFWGVDSVAVEVAERAPAPFEARMHRDLPSHWFVQVLPLVGRTTFCVYLFFHWSEKASDEIHIDHLVRSVRLLGRWHARLHLFRLHRASLLVRAAEDASLLVVSDPPPPTRFGRLRLRFAAIPRLRFWLVQAALGLALSALGILALVLLSRTSQTRP